MDLELRVDRRGTHSRVLGVGRSHCDTQTLAIKTTGPLNPFFGLSRGLLFFYHLSLSSI